MLEVISIIKSVFSFLKNNKTMVVVIYAAIASLLVYYLFMKAKSLSEDNERLSTNQIALTEQVQQFKTESGKNAAKVTELTMTAGEFKQTCAEQMAVIDDLNIKVKRLESVSTTATQTVVGGTTTLRDTIVVHDTVTADGTIVNSYDTLQTFKWRDNWNAIEGTIKGKDVDCQYNGIDTLTIVAHRVPKRFLWIFKYGTKYVEVDIVNANPSTKVTYNRTIKLTKK